MFAQTRRCGARPGADGVTRPVIWPHVTAVCGRQIARLSGRCLCRCLPGVGPGAGRCRSPGRPHKTPDVAGQPSRHRQWASSVELLKADVSPPGCPRERGVLLPPPPPPLAVSAGDARSLGDTVTHRQTDAQLGCLYSAIRFAYKGHSCAKACRKVTLTSWEFWWWYGSEKRLFQWEPWQQCLNNIAHIST